MAMCANPKLAPRICRACGETYTPTGVNQKYCKPCGKLEHREACRTWWKKHHHEKKISVSSDEYNIAFAKAVYYYHVTKGLDGEDLEVALKCWRNHRTVTPLKRPGERPVTEFERIGAEPKVFANQPPEKFAKLIGQYLNTF